MRELILNLALLKKDTRNKVLLKLMKTKNKSYI